MRSARRLSEIADLEGDALTDAIRSETSTLDREYRDVETKLSAAVIAEGARTMASGRRPDRSRQSGSTGELIGRASSIGSDADGRHGADRLARRTRRRSCSSITSSRVTRSPWSCSGRPASIARPVSLTAPTSNRHDVEDTVTPPVFATGDLAYLGVERPTVPSRRRGLAHACRICRLSAVRTMTRFGRWQRRPARSGRVSVGPCSGFRRPTSSLQTDRLGAVRWHGRWRSAMRAQHRGLEEKLDLRGHATEPMAC